MQVCVYIQELTGLPINFFTENEKSTFSVTNEMYTSPTKPYSQVYSKYLCTYVTDSNFMRLSI